MAASNLMIDARGQVSGLVDQVDLSTGDPLVVPEFALAMLGDVHAWPQVARYAKGWRRAWALDAQEWDLSDLLRSA